MDGGGYNKLLNFLFYFQTLTNFHDNFPDKIKIQISCQNHNSNFMTIFQTIFQTIFMTNFMSKSQLKFYVKISFCSKSFIFFFPLWNSRKCKILKYFWRFKVNPLDCHFCDIFLHVFCVIFCVIFQRNCEFLEIRFGILFSCLILRFTRLYFYLIFLVILVSFSGGIVNF